MNAINDLLRIAWVEVKEKPASAILTLVGFVEAHKRNSNFFITLPQSDVPPVGLLPALAPPPAVLPPQGFHSQDTPEGVQFRSGLLVQILYEFCRYVRVVPLACASGVPLLSMTTNRELFRASWSGQLRAALRRSDYLYSDFVKS